MRQQTFELIVLIWNAHVVARFWGQPQHLAAAEETIRKAVAEGVLPIDALDAFEALSARRQHPPFVDDPRAVGQWELRETAAGQWELRETAAGQWELRETAAGQWNLRCDARMPPS